MSDCCKNTKDEVAEPESCQVCGEPLATAPVVLCQKCSTPHHRECWRYNRGCSVYGCACRTFKAPSPALSNAGEGTFTSLQPTSNVTFAILLTSAIFVLLASIGVTTFFATPLPMVVGIPAYIFALLSSIFYKQGHYQLTFDNDKGTVNRQLVVQGRRIFEAERDWLKASDIVEVHLHRYMDLQFGATEEVYAALQDGSRQLIQWTRPANKRYQTMPQMANLEQLAEKVADFADTTVRLIENQLPPTEEEIRLAAEERKAVDGQEPPPLLEE